MSIDPKKLRRKIDAVFAELAGTEWFEELGDGKLAALPGHLSVQIDAAAKSSDLPTLEKLLAHEHPRVRMRAATQLKSLLKEEAVVSRGNSFEDILHVAEMMWEKGKFTQHSEAYLALSEEKGIHPISGVQIVSPREFCRDLFGLRWPNTKVPRIVDEDSRDGSPQKKGYEFFLEKYITIADKEGNRTPFIPNAIQRDRHRRWAEIYSYLPPAGLQEDSIKSRQVGYTTDVAGGLLPVSIISHPNCNASVTIDDKKNLPNVFEKIENFFNCLPYQPSRTSPGSTDRGLFFARDGLNNTIQFFTAGGDDPGMSWTFHFQLNDEIPKWPGSDAKVQRNMKVINNSRAKLPFGWKINQGTGEGQGQYYDRYKRLDKANHGKNPDIKHNVLTTFYGWYFHEEYRSKPSAGYVPDYRVEEYWARHPEIQAYVNKRHRRHAADHVNDYKYWVERQLSDEFNWDFDSFQAEFPANWEEAFSGSTLHFYPGELTRALYELCEPPYRAGDLFLKKIEHYGEKRLLTETDILFDWGTRIDETVHFKLWRLPSPNHDYILAGDPASGVASFKPEDADYSSLKVFDQTTRQWVARYRAICEPEELAYKAIALAAYYRGRFAPWIISPRRDAYGKEFLHVLKQPENMYGARSGEHQYHLYRDQKTEDSARAGTTDFYGFDENSASRLGLYTVHKQFLNRMVQNPPTFMDFNPHHQAVESMKWKMLDADAVDEMTSFVRNRGGKYEAPRGKHDDLLTCEGLSLIADRTQQTPQSQQVPLAVSKQKKGPLSDFYRDYEKRRNRQRGSRAPGPNWSLR